MFLDAALTDIQPFCNLPIFQIFHPLEQEHFAGPRREPVDAFAYALESSPDNDCLILHRGMVVQSIERVVAVRATSHFFPAIGVPTAIDRRPHQKRFLIVWLGSSGGHANIGVVQQIFAVGPAGQSFDLRQ